MFKADPKSRKLLTSFQSAASVQPRSRSVEASKTLYDNAPGRVTIRWNRRTGGVQSVRGILTEPGEGSGRDIADQFLADNRQLFGMPEENTGLRWGETKVHRSAQHVRYQQFYHDLPVVGATVTVHLDQANRVQMVNGNYCPNVEVKITPSPISTSVAIKAVLNVLQAEEHSSPDAELVIFSTGTHSICAYQVRLHANDPFGDWVFFVDAATGEIADSYNALHFVQGKGQVYNTNPRRDDTLISADLFDLNESQTLSGTYFRVKNATKGGQNASVTGPGAYDFLYSDAANTHFDEVMVYYHLNKVAKFFRNVGYDEHTNPMSVSVHVPNPDDGNPDYDNAYFSPFEQAFYFGHGDVLSDLAQEAAVIYHEYTHSVVDAAQSFMATPEAGALHEGYADYFACSLTNDPKIGEFAVQKSGEEFLRDLRSQRTYETMTNNDVHADGEIWGATCWKIRETLGRRIADLLVYDSLWYLPPNAAFLDACDGILEADAKFFGGEHVDTLQRIFTTQKITTEVSTKYTIASSAGHGGTIAPSGAISVSQGATQRFTVQADSGFRVRHVLVDDVSVGAVTQYAFEQIKRSHTIEAFFDNEMVTAYTISAKAGPGGVISPSGEMSVNQGGSQAFSIVPDAGHIIRHVLVDGNSVGAVREYTFDNVSAGHTIEALFEEGGLNERTIIVPGNQKWTDSGLELEVGDIVRFSALGTVIYDKRGNACGPGGTSWADSHEQQDPLWKKPHAGLIGKIEGIGAPFFIGDLYTVRAGSRGRLLLGINDFWYRGNSGEFSVRVKLLNKTS
ncbi:hypothetical protein CSA56_13675 [candidate division KSB3 bacterium]|uniref:FTP domain-containing protein n=1 Tax=candidate division KSB3 bacterium TaxID=2044937 RepID=A0A2G6KBC7_9BACT|nr:MAG: hypothetical protein CSA56_13675 [candidate division KSB3 bacterium]